MEYLKASDENHREAPSRTPLCHAVRLVAVRCTEGSVSGRTLSIDLYTRMTKADDMRSRRRTFETHMDIIFSNPREKKRRTASNAPRMSMLQPEYVVGPGQLYAELSRCHYCFKICTGTAGTNHQLWKNHDYVEGLGQHILTFSMVHPLVLLSGVERTPESTTGTVSTPLQLWCLQARAPNSTRNTPPWMMRCTCASCWRRCWLQRL